MRYTSDLAMNERSLRDVERWKDKIEVRLDNRQVFFLFFGSALVACLLFILGVMVGKRLESRGKAVAPEMEDPLALLDKVAASPLAAAAESPPAVPAPAKAPAPPAASPPPARVAVAAAPPVARVKEPAKEALKEPGKEVAPPPVAAVAALELHSDPPVAAKSMRAALPPPPAEGPKGRGRFALQLGSFPDRAEADAFARQFGGQTYVVPSEIPGRGLWYRVRVGDYGSAKDAVAAKASFEKQHNVIAYVVGTPGK
jgi:cell division protein FtsN